MSMEEKKPFYKKWWIWAIAVLVFAIVFGEEAEPTETIAPKEPVAQEEIIDEPTEELEDEQTIIELNKEFTSADYTVTIQRAKIDDGKLIIVFDWENQSDWDPAHFELLGSITVEQDSEYLEELSGDRKYKQIKRNRFDVYDLEYELISESDITVKITAANGDFQNEFIIKYE